VTSATSVPILVFLGLSVLDLDPMYAAGRQTSDVRCASSLNASALWRRGIIIIIIIAAFMERHGVGGYRGACRSRVTM